MCYLADHKKLPHSTRIGLNNEINMLGNTTEFLYEYKDSNIDMHCIHEHLMRSNGISEKTVARFTKKHLGFSVGLSENYDSVLLKKHNLDYIDDDWTPDQKMITKSRKRKFKSQNNKYIHREYNDNK